LEEACSDFGKSQQLSPAVGTLLNVARCEELLGSPETAIGLYLQAAALAEDAADQKRAAFAREQAERLERSTPRLVLDTTALPRHTEIRLDSKRLAPTDLDRALRVNPGSHLLEITPPGGAVTRRLVRVPPEAVEEPISIELAVEAQRAAAPRRGGESSPGNESLQLSGPGGLSSPASGASAPIPVEGGSWSSWRWAGFTTALVGLAGTTAGAAMVIGAHTKADSADCDESLVCTPEGDRDRKEAIALLDSGRVVAVTGGVVTLAGVALFVWAPPGERASAKVAVRGPGFLELSGRF
jgi:hypothetical protein